MWQLLPRLNNGARSFRGLAFCWWAFLTAFDFDAFHLIGFRSIPYHTTPYHTISFHSIWFLFFGLAGLLGCSFIFTLFRPGSTKKNTLANLCKCIFNRRWQLRRAAILRLWRFSSPLPSGIRRSLCDDRCLWGGNTHRRWRWCCCKFVDCACCASQEVCSSTEFLGNAVDDTRSCVPPDMAIKTWLKGSLLFLVWWSLASSAGRQINCLSRAYILD